MHSPSWSSFLIHHWQLRNGSKVTVLARESVSAGVQQLMLRGASAKQQKTDSTILSHLIQVLSIHTSLSYLSWSCTVTRLGNRKSSNINHDVTAHVQWYFCSQLLWGRNHFLQSSEASALFCHYKNSLWNLTKQEKGRQEHVYLMPIHVLLL